MTNKGNLLVRYSFWLLSIVIMVFIFIMSSENADDSGETSSGFLRFILCFIFPDFLEMTSSEQLALIAQYHYFIRKAAHFSIYAALGCSLFCAVNTYKIKTALKLLVSMSASLVYAASDEYHQTFVPGRAGMIRDVVLDFSGAVSGIIGILIIISVYKAIKKRGNRMRKKELMKRLFELVNTVEVLNKRIADLEEENKNLRLVIESSFEVKATVDEVTFEDRKEEEEEEKAPAGFSVASVDDANFCEEDIETETNQTEYLLYDEAMEYGASVIGKITVESAKYCDIVTAGGSRDTKELLGLIMGKSELCKNEILGIALSEVSYENKIELIDAQLTEAVEYFKSISEQK